MGMIIGSGRVSLLSGRIWHYRVRFGFATRCAPANRWAMQAACARGGRLGRAEDSAQKPNSNKKTFFLFLKLFYKLQINLNSNQIEFQHLLLAQ
jgi:hypothetical protein